MKSGESRSSFTYTPDLDLYSPVARDLCRQLGITAGELQVKSVSDFQSPLVPIETAERLLQHHTERRKIALRLLETELSRRQRLGKSSEIHLNSQRSLEFQYSKSVTPGRKVGENCESVMDMSGIVAQRLASRRHRAELELKVAENRELMQLRNLEQIEKAMKERSERSMKVWEETKEKEQEMRLKFNRRRQRALEILEKKRLVGV